MTMINLLPWRETLRKERQRQFASSALGAVILMVLIVLYVHVHINGLKETQEVRNKYLQTEIEKVDKKIKEIKTLETEKSQLLARMNVIQQLQRHRPQIVYLFSEFVRAVPEGVYFTQLSQKDDVISIEGKAQSNARVSALMRNLDASPWLENPQLEVIQTVEENNQRVSKFKLRVRQSTEASKEQVGQG